MDQLQKLKAQIKFAAEVHQKLQKEHSKVVQQNQQLQVEKEVAINECEALKEQLKTIKLAQALAVPEKTETRELKIQINNYLREIDRCLSLLNKD
ncbi:MAG: hypothetical protein ACKOX3_10545 [Bacteroidota bacterium]